MMVKRLIAVFLLAGPAAVAAQTAPPPNDGRLELVGTANPACVIRAPSAAIGNNMSFNPVSSMAGEIAIAEFVDADAVPRGGSIEVILPVVCNSAHRVLVRSGNGALRRVGAPVQSGPFAQSVAYQVATIWGGQQGSLATGAGPLIINTPEARAGQLSLAISVPAGGPPLVAGTYSDQIILELQAAD